MKKPNEYRVAAKKLVESKHDKEVRGVKTFNINLELYQHLKEHCAKVNKSMSEVINRLIEGYLQEVEK